MPDVVGRDHGLDVCREPAAPGVQVQTLIGEMHFNALIYQFTEIGPISEVARAPVDLVDEHAVLLTTFERLKHPVKDRPSKLSRGLLLLELFDNGQVPALRIPLDGLALLSERRAILPLPERGDPDV